MMLSTGGHITINLFCEHRNGESGIFREYGFLRKKRGRINREWVRY